MLEEEKYLMLPILSFESKPFFFLISLQAEFMRTHGQSRLSLLISAVFLQCLLKINGVP